MVKKQLFISVLFSLGLFFPLIEAGFPTTKEAGLATTEKLKEMSRKQLKKLETNIFKEVAHRDVNQISEKTLTQASQLLDALIKKSNFEQFEKSVNEFHQRNLIDDRQKSRFLSKKKLLKENNAIVTSIDQIKKALEKRTLKKEEIDNLNAANNQLIKDLALEEQSDVKNKGKYEALKAYTTYLGKACTALFVVNTTISFSGQPESDNLNVITAVVSGLYLLGKVASFFLLEDQPKAALLKDFTSSLQNLDKVAHILPENAKLPVALVGYGATAYPYVAPTIKAIWEEMGTWPLEDVEHIMF